MGRQEEQEEYGGYSVGSVQLTANTNLFVCIGGSGASGGWNGGGKGEEALLKSCYKNCLRLAIENGCKTIAFPSISTGIYHFPLEKASVIAIDTILTFCREHTELEESTDGYALMNRPKAITKKRLYLHKKGET